MLTFPKPKERRKLAITIKDDGAEVCNRETAEGRREYKRRVDAMTERQKDMCCLYGFIESCPGSLIGWLPTFEHEDGRGGGKRDDRIEKDGRRYNGAAHWNCNQEKGSRFIDYNQRENEPCAKK